MGPTTRGELLGSGVAVALAGLLDVAVPDTTTGGLPLLWHWLYFLDRPAQADLGPDGHPVTGGVVSPPGDGWKRMWAGGRVRGVAPLRADEVAIRSARLGATREKTGRSGRLRIVTVSVEIEQDGSLVRSEEQDIVYRDIGPARHPAETGHPSGPERVATVDDAWVVPIDPTLLFRFSALTYNSHRIHYDHPYALQVEGYPGLVVHGPLQAIAMSQAVADHPDFDTPDWSGQFDYRLVAPLFDGQGMRVYAARAVNGFTARVTDDTGRTTATATWQVDG